MDNYYEILSKLRESGQKFYFIVIKSKCKYHSIKCLNSGNNVYNPCDLTNCPIKTFKEKVLNGDKLNKNNI